MALERKILTITDPTIAIDEMSITDYEDGDKGRIIGDRDSKRLGSLYPFVQINGYKFDENEIVRMKLDVTGFYPTISVTVATSNGVFLSKSYPKDGDPLSLFIRSKKEEFKPIRLDFEITFINSAPSTDSTGEKIAFTINGNIRIPNIHTEVSKAFRDLSSYDALIQIAEDLNLGFASNDTDTADKMTWVCPFDSYRTFIEDTTEASYKKDDSFFTSFIDHYYYLNFVNVHQQFSEELEIDAAITNLSMLTDYDEGQTNKSAPMPLILSNFSQVQGTSMYIDKYTLHNNTGLVGINNGYRRFLQFYDSSFITEKPEEKFHSFAVEPLNTEGSQDKQLLKGRNDEDIFETHQKFKWMGTQYGLPDSAGNVHENYQYAKILNWQNNVELNKMVLHVVTAQANFNLYRGQRIPIVIVNDGSTLRKQVTKDEKDNPDMPLPLTYDKFLSGYYMIKGMKYTYNIDEGIFRQEIFLTRREWPLPV